MHALDVMKNTDVQRKMYPVKYKYSHFHKKDTLFYMAKKTRVMFKKWSSKSAISVEKVAFLSPRIRERGYFSNLGTSMDLCLAGAVPVC